MTFEDKPRFAKKMIEMATALGRTVDDYDVDVFFKQLADHGIGVILKGMDRAMRDRDPNDQYLKTMMLTVPEIRAAIDNMAEQQIEEVSAMGACSICHGSGWMVGKGEAGQMITWPCECLYNAAKKALKKAGRRSSMDSSLDYMRARIVRVYEGHHKHWGMEIPKEEK